MRKVLGITAALCCLFMARSSSAYDGFCRSATDVAELPPRHWCEVPNSALEAVEKAPSEFDDWNGSSSAKYDSFQRVVGIDAVTQAWNGAAFDTSRNCLLVFGGGHDDYGGNEIYRFCLADLEWSRLTDPTPFPNRYPEFQNSDGTPISRHTYNGLAYIPTADRFFVFDGAPDHGPGTCGITGTWTFDLPARAAAGSYSPSQWELRTTQNEPDRGCDNASVYDPLSGNVVFKSSQGTFTYDINGAGWTKVSDAGRRNEKVALAIDPQNRRLVEVGGGVTALWALDNAFAGGAVSTSGATSIQDKDDPGLAYDIRAQAVVAWHSGTSVYTLDVDSRVWTAIPAAAGNLADPGSVSTSGGVFGRFGYSPEVNVYIYVDRVSDNVMLYRLSDGEPPLPPSPPANLAVQ